MGSDVQRQEDSRSLDRGRPLTLSTTAIDVAVKEMKKVFGNGLETFAYLTGESYSKAILGRRPQLKTEPPDQTIAQLIELADAYGWGTFEVFPISERGDWLKVTVKHNVFHDIEDGCYFLKGLMKGIMEQLFAKQGSYKVIEVIHSEPECVFELKPSQ